MSRLRFEHGLAAIALFSPLSKTLGNAAFLITAALFLRDWRAGRARPSATPLDGAILLWIVSQVLSTATSVDPLESVRDLRSIGHWGVFYLTVWGIAAGAPLEKLLGIWLASGAVAALQGIAEVSVGFDLLHEAGEHASGFFTGHLPFGHYQTMLFAVALGLLLESRRRGHQVLAGALTVLYAAAVVASKGRGPWLALAVIALAIAFRRAPRRLLLALAVVVAIQAAVMAREPGGLGAYYGSYVVLEAGETGDVSDESVYSNLWRLSMWREGLRLFELRPVLGTGVESMGALSREFHVPFRDFGVAHLHSNYVEVLATRGLTGLAILIALGLAFVRVLRTGLESVPAGAARATVIGGLAAVGIHAVHGLTYYSLGSAPVQVGFYWIAGLALGVVLRHAPDVEAPVAPRSLTAMLSVVGVAWVVAPWLADRPALAIVLALAAGTVAVRRVLLGGSSVLETAATAAFVTAAFAAAVLIAPLPEHRDLAIGVIAAAAATYAVGYASMYALTVHAARSVGRPS